MQRETELDALLALETQLLAVQRLDEAVSQRTSSVGILLCRSIQIQLCRSILCTRTQVLWIYGLGICSSTEGWMTNEHPPVYSRVPHEICFAFSNNISCRPCRCGLTWRRPIHVRSSRCSRNRSRCSASQSNWRAVAHDRSLVSGWKT